MFPILANETQRVIRRGKPRDCGVEEPCGAEAQRKGGWLPRIKRSWAEGAALVLPPG